MIRKILWVAFCTLTASWGVASAAGDERGSPSYRLGPEDVLEIAVWKEEGLQKEVIVRPDGALTFPLAGEIKAQGRTVEEVREEIAKRLDRFIPDPVVSVSLVRIGSNKIYIIGQTNKPGVYPSGQYVDVMQALSMAGGLTPFAARARIQILRRVDGRSTVIPFDYEKVEKGTGLEQNIVLQNGDVIIVP